MKISILPNSMAHLNMPISCWNLFPNLSPNSLKVYLSALRKLNNNLPPTSVKYLLDVDDILSKIEGKSNNTKKSYLNAVVVALQSAQGKSKKYADVIERYEKLRDGYQNEYSEFVASHEKTEKQAANWVRRHRMAAHRWQCPARLLAETGARQLLPRPSWAHGRAPIQ